MLYKTYTLQQLNQFRQPKFCIAAQNQVKVKLLAVCVCVCGMTKCAGVCSLSVGISA